MERQSYLKMCRLSEYERATQLAFNQSLAGGNCRMEPIACPNFIDPEVWKRAAYYSVTRKAVEYLRLHIDEDTCLTRVSAAACMEATSFARAFRRNTGMTFMNFAQAYKIGIVTSRLEQSDDPISVIAYECGFHSMVTLQRAFRKLVGQTPSGYRAAFLAAHLARVGNGATMCKETTAKYQIVKGFPELPGAINRNTYPGAVRRTKGESRIAER